MKCNNSNLILWELPEWELDAKLDRKNKKIACICGKSVGLSKTPKAGADIRDRMIARHNR